MHAHAAHTIHKRCAHLACTHGLAAADDPHQTAETMEHDCYHILTLLMHLRKFPMSSCL